MRHGVLVKTSAGTFLTVEFDREDEARRFHKRLHGRERVRVEMRTHADTVETVDIEVFPDFDAVQPIVRLASGS